VKIRKKEKCRKGKMLFGLLDAVESKILSEKLKVFEGYKT
jgi:hypothetical protein